jgi:hypothetical protein
VRGVPLTVVVNAEGRVTYSRRGRIETAVAIDSVLAAVALSLAEPVATTHE